MGLVPRPALAAVIWTAGMVHQPAAEAVVRSNSNIVTACSAHLRPVLGGGSGISTRACVCHRDGEDGAKTLPTTVIGTVEMVQRAALVVVARTTKIAMVYFLSN